MSLKLTPREVTVAELVATGISNEEIAAQLHLTPKSVRNYMSLILKKNGLANRTQLAVAMERVRIYHLVAEMARHLTPQQWVTLPAALQNEIRELIWTSSSRTATAQRGRRAS